MLPKPLPLRRRRWTLVFSLPFTAFMAFAGAYSVFLMFSAERVAVMLGACGAFVSLCVGGTLGKAALDAWRNEEPAVVVGADGLHDLTGETGLVPWHRIDAVRLDDYEQRILVTLVVASPDRAGRLVSATRRLLAGADYKVDLRGLAYRPRELAAALAEHHRQGRSGGVGRGHHVTRGQATGHPGTGNAPAP